MARQEKEYQHVFRATSLFGGVQFIQIILAIIKSKVIALFLGPTGFGILRLLKSTVNVAGTLTNLGLPASAVKFITQEFAGGNRQKAFELITILKRLLWFSGLAGAFLLILFSPLVSRLLFNSNAYTFSLIWLSAAVLLNQLAKGRISILQSLRKLRQLAKANLWGSALSLLLVAPLYYFFREKAIVPAILITAASSFYFSWYYLKKHKIPLISIGYKQSLQEGKGMLKLGLVLSFSGVLMAITAYLLQLYVNALGGLAQVGLFSAGFLILSTYGGLIFNAMAKDYYPRLSGIAKDNGKIREAVKQQALVALLIMAPIIVLFLALAPQAIKLLLSERFIAIVPMVTWGILGLPLKAAAWAMSYIIVAKGDARVFVKTDVIFISLQLLLNMAGYYFEGLTGLGISFLVYYLIYFIGIYRITHRRYSFYYTKEFFIIFSICVAFCGASFGFTFIKAPLWRYLLMAITVLLSGGFSLYYLNKKVGFHDLIKGFFTRHKSE